jgi:hypothetical protein
MSALLGQAQLDYGLVSSYYFFGNARDTTGSNHGKVVGPELCPDRFGNPEAAYRFDGQDDYITLGSNTSLKQFYMTISFWMKIEDWEFNHRNLPSMPLMTTRVRDGVEYYEAYCFGLTEANHKLNFGQNSYSQVQVSSMASSPVELNKWYHLVGMFDSDTSYFFVNGKLQQKNFKGFYSTYLPGDSVVFGYDGNHTPDTFKYQNYGYFHGVIDDIRFYNRVLPQKEINQLYLEPDPKKNTPKVSSIPYSDLLRTLWYIPVAFFLFIILTIIFVRWRLRLIKRREMERTEVERQLAQMEMRSLRGQMNPHFIFNAINSIQHYVLTNEKDLANKYLVKFSQLMRNILELSKQELISLKDELDTISLYLDIESLRFDNAFTYSIQIAPTVNLTDFRLPPLIIQPFVENAIWHGLLLKKGNKTLNIIVEQKNDSIRITIDDNGIGREASMKYKKNELKRQSFGMEITRERLAILEKIFGIAMKYEVIDKRDETGEPAGTSVVLDMHVKS